MVGATDVNKVKTKDSGGITPAKPGTYLAIVTFSCSRTGASAMDTWQVTISG